jgi:transcription termination factor Rho
MAGEQLERSILESKEREELHAIASAMALKPTARSKKSDIIDLILEATGVEAPTNGNGAHTNGNGNGHANGNGAYANGHVDEVVSTATAEPASDSDTTASETAAPAPARRAPRARAAEVKDTSVTEDAPEAFTDAETDGDATEETDAESDGGRSQRSFTDEVESTLEEFRAQPHTGQQNGGSRSNGSGNGSAGSGNGNGQNHEYRNGNGSGSNSQVDAGNRRSRRRRGRDRERGDVQGTEAPWQGELVPVKGLLDLRDEGYGFLRTGGYLASQHDVYVSVSQARRFALRRGDAIEGACRPAGPSEKYPALLRIDTVSGMTPDEARQRPRFEDLTPLFPDSRLHLEMPGDPSNLTARIVDLISPIGKGQRGMIVSPPKAGKTTVMKQIAHSIEANNPDVHLMVLLVDERPEEVTDMRRSVRGEVIASTFDRPADEHTAVAELAIERAKRLVEQGRDVVIILDGITRLARAYNLAQPATGRIMSGGVDSGALYPPKKFFGAARNIEEGGSLTILATALVETGSKMDEVIFEEFKGTGNMELRLDRKLAERRLYPAIDVNASSTRHEELLFDRSELQQVWKLRRVLNALSNEGNAAAGLELLSDKIRTTKSNGEFLAEIAKAPSATN